MFICLKKENYNNERSPVCTSVQNHHDDSAAGHFLLFFFLVFPSSFKDSTCFLYVASNYYNGVMLCVKVLKNWLWMD